MPRLLGWLLTICCCVAFVIVGFMGLGIPFVIAWIWLSVVSRRQREHKRLLGIAEPNLHRRSQELSQWVEECQAIMSDEVLAGRTYLESEAWQRARRKTNGIRRSTEYWAELLDKDDIRLRWQRALRELSRMADCCARCPKANNGSDTPRCLILHEQPQAINADLRFRPVDDNSGRRTNGFRRRLG